MAQDSTQTEHHQIVDESRQLADDARDLYDTLRHDNPLTDYYEQNPYAVLAAAAGVGYVLGGGLLSPFTRRLVRVGLKAAVLPIAASQLRGLAQGDSGDNISTGQVRESSTTVTDN